MCVARNSREDLSVWEFCVGSKFSNELPVRKFLHTLCIAEYAEWTASNRLQASRVMVDNINDSRSSRSQEHNLDSVWALKVFETLDRCDDLRGRAKELQPQPYHRIYRVSGSRFLAFLCGHDLIAGGEVRAAG